MATIGTNMQLKDFEHKGYKVKFTLNYSNKIDDSFLTINISKKYRILQLKYPFTGILSLDIYSQLAAQVYDVIDFIDDQVNDEVEEQLEVHNRLKEEGKKIETLVEDFDDNYDVHPFSHLSEDLEDIEEIEKLTELEPTEEVNPIMSNSVSDWFNNTDTNRFLKQ